MRDLETSSRPGTSTHDAGVRSLPAQTVTHRRDRLRTDHGPRTTDN